MQSTSSSSTTVDTRARSCGFPTVGTWCRRKNGKLRLYWEEHFGSWRVFTMAGMQEMDLHEPVCHVSYYEADAFARWAGARLCREEEWEVVAAGVPLAGNLLESRQLHPDCRRAGKLRSAADVRRCLGVDRKRLFGLSGIQAGIRRARGIQRQVHVQPVCITRRLLRHSAFSSSGQLPKLLSTRGALAVLRYSFGARRQLKHNGDQQTALSSSNHCGGCSRRPEPARKMSSAEAFL